MVDTPLTRYADLDGVSLAYQVFGEGGLDLVFVPGGVSHVDLAWQDRRYARSCSSAARPAGARYLAAHIAGARLVEMEGVDHLPWLGDADAVLDAVQEFLTNRRPVRRERRVCTVLFTDIAGSTERAAEAGDRRWRALLDDHHDAIRAQVERFDGRLVKTLGDGALALFDGPAPAVDCALEAVRDASLLGLEIRAGLHAGECELIDDDVGGIAVHVAARVAALAEPGEVLVSSTVKDLVAGSEFDFSDRGLHELKGVPAECRLYAPV